MTMQAERQKLLNRRAELEARLAKIKADYARGLDRDLEEQAQQLENAEVLEALTRQAVSELAEIDKKLATRTE